jgi:hypothetical protein
MSAFHQDARFWVSSAAGLDLGRSQQSLDQVSLPSGSRRKLLGITRERLHTARLVTSRICRRRRVVPRSAADSWMRALTGATLSAV